MDISSDIWWKDAFGQTYIDAWQSIYSDKRTQNEALFILNELKLNKGATLLDAPCGWGRHSILFSKSDLYVTGLEYSLIQIKSAEERAENANASVAFVQADLRSFSFQKKFDVVVCLGNSFGYFSDKDNEKVISNFSRVLKKGGTLVLDLANISGMLAHSSSGQVIDIPGGKIYLDETNFDSEHLTATLEWHIHLNKKIETIRGKLRFYTFAEIKKILLRYNVTISNVFGSFDGDDYSIDSPRMIIFARKD